MPDRTPLDARRNAIEEEYFRKRDAELIARQQAERAERAAAAARAQHAAMLADALKLTLAADGGELSDSIHTLLDAGVTPPAAAVVEWLPALEVAWEGGVDVAERDRLLALAGLGRAPSEVSARLSAWCEQRPDPRVFAAARAVLMSQAERLGSREGRLLLDRVLAACETTAAAAGGWTGFRRVSAGERRVIEDIRADLKWPAAPGPLD